MGDWLVEQIGERLSSAERILVVSHIRPDGDAIGSLLGMGQALEDSGKQVRIVSADGVPSIFSHLEGCDLVEQNASGEFDLVVVLDCSELSRVGLSLVSADINIDHHITNTRFAEINLVDISAVATAEILTEHFPYWGLPITKRVAAGLLTGIITDTLGFRTSNMTSKAMRLSAQLMDYGVDISELYSRSLIQRSYEAIRFWGAGLQNIEREGPIVWTTLTMEERRTAGYPGRDDADLINLLTSINGSLIALIFVEQPNGNIKVSWRAQPGFDISQIAMRFGGGGHPGAAGAEIEGTLDEIRRVVLQETSTLFVEEEIRV